MKSFTSFSRVGRFGALYFSRLGSRAHHCLQLQCIFFPLFHYQASTKYLVLEETGNTPATPEKFFHHPYLRCKLPSPCIIHLSLDFTFFFPFNPTVYFTQLANHNSKEYPCKSTTYQPSSPIKQNKIDIIISSLPYPTRRTNQDDQVCASQHSTARIC